MENVTPVKGMVWKHAIRKDYKGEPLNCTISSVSASRNIVYSTDYVGRRIKTPLSNFARYVKEVVTTPDPKARVSGPKLSVAECRALAVKAEAAGLKAGKEATPQPMIVQQRLNPLDDSSPVVKTYAPVMDGVCGFAWVVICPGTGSFARYAKQHLGAYKRYGGGGVDLWVKDFNQSMERKMAYARAYADVLREAGIDAYPGSRMD